VPKFIIRGEPGVVSDSATKLRNHPSVRIVDATPKMLLVETDSEDELRSAVSAKDVLIVPEQQYERPDDRPIIKK
jgi:hypothetical protein